MRPTRLRDEEILFAWWTGLPFPRPQRVLPVDVRKIFETKDRWMSERSLDLTVIDALEICGFKRKLFEDGWFYVPPARLVTATAAKPPVVPSLVDPKIVFTYFVQSVQGGPIKIGRSEDVLRRIAEMQTANPFRLRLLLAIPFDEAEEGEMHAMFADLRIDGGEWFQPGEVLTSFIDERILRLCAVLKV